MTREQAINYLISRGLTQEQVGDVVRALTYKPRDCANCKHYVVKDTRTNWGSQETTKIYGCECWECEYEPTTKNDLVVDCISRAEAIKAMQNKAKKLKNEDTINGLCGAVAILYEMPSVTPQLSVPEVTALAEWTEKLTKASEDAYNKGYADGVKSVNICPHCGEYIGEEE